MHMNIDAYPHSLSPGHAHAQVSHFRTYTGEAAELFDAPRDVIVVLVVENLRGLLKILSLTVVEANRCDEGVDELRR